MGIGSVFGKVAGFISGVMPTLMKFGEAISMVLSLVKIGVAERDVDKLSQVCDAMDALAMELDDLKGETLEVSSALRRAIDVDGPGGKDITGLEAKDLAMELDDIPVELKDIGVRISEITKAVKAAL